MRNLNTAEVTYSSTHGSTYGDIPDLVAAGLLDDRYTNPQFNGYRFTVVLDGWRQKLHGLCDWRIVKHFALRLLQRPGLCHPVHDGLDARSVRTGRNSGRQLLRLSRKGG